MGRPQDGVWEHISGNCRYDHHERKWQNALRRERGASGQQRRGGEIDEWLERGRKREEAVMICCLLHYCTDRYKWSLMLAETTEGKGKPTMYYTAHEVNKAYEYVRTAEVISRCKRQDIPISGILKVRNHLQCGRARHRILGDRLPRTEGFVECFFETPSLTWLQGSWQQGRYSSWSIRKHLT